MCDLLVRAVINIVAPGDAARPLAQWIKGQFIKPNIVLCY